jgi:hypothetical protein
MAVLDTDYLVVGAGASGMAFVDELLTSSDADVVVVDRRSRPGGHWNDAYSFVRLHQPSAYYGVNSTPLGRDRVVDTGPEAGFYERASAPEICAYYQQVLEDRFLASGRVRFLGMHDHRGTGGDGHLIVSRLTGDEVVVRPRRGFVDASYLESQVPRRHTRRFVVDRGARVIPPNDLVELDPTDGPVTGFTVLGAGKTGMDTCTWLLDQGVAGEAIRWIKPRDSWFFDRATVQPLDQVATVIEGVAHDLEAAAEALDVADLFARLEANGRLMRVDPEVEPQMFRAATLSRAEAASLRRIGDVVRKGHVVRVGLHEIELAGGRVATDPGQVHVDCTAAGLPNAPARPIFAGGTITLQTMRIGLTPFNAAMIGYVESTRGDVTEKNRLCPPNVYPSAAVDWLPTTRTSTCAEVIWGEQPDIAEWLERSRLNLARGWRDHLDEPRMQEALTRLVQHREPAIENLERLVPVVH